MSHDEGVEAVYGSPPHEHLHPDELVGSQTPLLILPPFHHLHRAPSLSLSSLVGVCWRGGFSEGRLARRELEGKAGRVGQFQGRLRRIRPSAIDVTGLEQGQCTGCA